ncbi:DUF6474 family protein [Haloactinomyces albus]|uniref:Uncharacterized protein n=1 Tax=Haloactinomyces albus TaxID=1352928 RepID=A0AAE3ZDP2_9ACTN|nr:DUF6474 family protein [Haloactinomyces albus]MDR7301940.1 hypothetical protein [Haloactinomyces albus]
MARSVKKQAGKQDPATPQPTSSREHRKDVKKTAKAEQKAAKTRASTEQKSAKATAKAAKKTAKAQKKGEYGRITPGNTKKILGILKIAGPAIAPFAAKAAFTARDGYDRMRARRIGIPVEDLGRFSGRGAALHARIAGDADALHDLRMKAGGQGGNGDSAARQVGVEQFTDRAEQRLSQLTSAVRAAERMPGNRRRAAHRAVAGELDRIEADLLHRLEL